MSFLEDEVVVRDEELIDCFVDQVSHGDSIFMERKRETTDLISSISDTYSSLKILKLPAPYPDL